MAVVSELISRFSFLGSLTPQVEFNSNLKASIGLLAGAAAGLTAAAGGFFAWTAGVLDTIDPLAQLNRETGVAVENIQALGFAASVNNSSVDALSGSFREMNKRMGEFVQTGGGPAKEIIEKLGISIKDAEGNVRSADSVFLGLSKTLQGMSRGEQANVLDKLGIDQSLIQLVSLSADEVGKLTARARALGVVTNEQADNAAAFNDSLTTLKFGLSGIQNAVAVGFAPALTRLTDRFIAFIEVNQDLIKNGLTWLGDVLESTMGFVERIAPVVLIAAGAFIAWQLATGGLVAIMGVLLSPVVLIAAGIVALLLIVDDLIVAFNGGQSVIRDFFLEFAGIDIVPILQDVVAAFDWMIATVSGLLEPWLASIGGLFSAVINLFTGDFSGALNDLKGSFSAFGDFVKGVFTALIPSDWIQMFADVIASMKALLDPWIESISEAFTGIINLFEGGFIGAIEGIKNAFASFGQYVLGIVSGMLPDWVLKYIGTNDGPPAGLSPNDAVAIGGNVSSSSSSSSIEQQVQINVSSSDPKQAGAAVNDALQEQLRTAKTQVNRGGR